jgi:hypothetical protein
MVLINLDALSDTELRCIAQQEGLPGWKDAERDDLMEQLQEKYEDADDAKETAPVGSQSRRFCTSLTDFGSHKQVAGMLPGVEELPKSYNETSIHLLLRDPEWAFAYWSISPSEKAEYLLDENDSPLFLRVHMTQTDGMNKSYFDISIGNDDEEWNINLPSVGYGYSVSLCAHLPNGEMQVLAESKTVETYPCYWESHYDEIAMNPALFSVQFSSVLTNVGEVADNQVLRNVAKILSKGVLES